MSTNPPAPEPSNSQPSYQPPAPGSSAPPPAPEYGSQPAAYPAAPPPAQHDSRTTGSNRLGLIAFIASLAAVIIGSILAYVAGTTIGSLGQYGTVDSSGSYVLDETAIPAEGEQAAASGALLTLAAFAVFGVLALWGFIQGIVAAVRNRGRGWGITAIILAVVGIGIVAIIYGAGVAAGIAPYVTS